MRSKKVILKLQRPLFGNANEILSYMVDEDDERISNPMMEELPDEAIEELFGEHHKVYYLAKHKQGKKTWLIRPIHQDLWV